MLRKGIAILLCVTMLVSCVQKPDSVSYADTIKECSVKKDIEQKIQYDSIVLNDKMILIEKGSPRIFSDLGKFMILENGKNIFQSIYDTLYYGESAPDGEHIISIVPVYLIYKKDPLQIDLKFIVREEYPFYFPDFNYFLFSQSRFDNNTLDFIRYDFQLEKPTSHYLFTPKAIVISDDSIVNYYEANKNEKDYCKLEQMHCNIFISYLNTKSAVADSIIELMEDPGPNSQCLVVKYNFLKYFYLFIKKN